MWLQEVRKTCLKRKHIYKTEESLKNKKIEPMFKSSNLDNTRLFCQYDNQPAHPAPADLRHIPSTLWITLQP